MYIYIYGPGFRDVGVLAWLLCVAPVLSVCLFALRLLVVGVLLACLFCLPVMSACLPARLFVCLLLKTP